MLKTVPSEFSVRVFWPMEIIYCLTKGSGGNKEVETGTKITYLIVEIWHWPKRVIRYI
jgi:hypothetical protein